MIKFLDAPDQLRGDHLWGGSEGGGNNPGDQPRVGGSPLNDTEHKEYLKFIGSQPPPTLKEQKDRAKIELRRLVIAHRDHFSKVPVDLEKNSSAKYEREHFVSDLRTNGTNNAWVKIGMAKLVDSADEPSDKVPVLRKIAFASWGEVCEQYEADDIICPPKTVIEHWVSRVGDIGKTDLQLGSFRWVTEEDVDGDDIADADPVWGIKTGDGCVRHIDTLPKFNMPHNFNLLHTFGEGTISEIGFVRGIKAGFPRPLSKALMAAFDGEAGKAFAAADAALESLHTAARKAKTPYEVGVSDRDTLMRAAQHAATALLDEGGGVAREDENYALFPANFEIHQTAPQCAPTLHVFVCACV